MAKLTPHTDKSINSLQLGLGLFKIYPYRSLLILGSLFVAGILEVLGVAALLPLVALFGDQGDINNDLYRGIMALFTHLHIPMSLGPLLIIISGLIIFKAIFSMIAMRNVGFAIANMANDMRLQLIYASMKARWSHFSTLPLGSMSNALGTETNRAAQTYLSLCRLASEAMVVCIYLVTVLFISWQLTVVALVLGAAIMGLLYKLVTMVKKAGKKQTSHMARLSNLITDTIASVKIIKAMGREEHFIKLLEKESVGLRDTKKRNVIGNQTLRVIREPIIVILIAGGIYIAHSYAQDTADTMSMASIVTFAFMFLRIIQKLTNLQALYQVFVANESAYVSLKGAIDRTEQYKEDWKGTGTPILKQAINCNNISYSHKGADQNVPVFENTSIVFPVNKFNAVIGPSGSGKTTLIDLIVGFYTPQDGQICIDDVPLDQINVQKWRQSIGYVPQECPLLHDSIFNNIAMGNEDITEEKVLKSLHMADASDFVERLDKGVHETVGERGQRFSGGQRQRIAIARALVTDPQLLILDEATSALDSETGEEIMRTAQRLSKKMTVIVISHDMRVQDYADNVYFIDAGKIQT